METWIIYALLGTLFSGAYVFIQKIAAERKYSAADFTLSVAFGQSASALLLWMIIGFPLVDLEKVIYLAIIAGVLSFGLNLSRIRSLKYMDTSIFFPMYKAIGPILVTMAGILVFKEHLTYLELLGIIIGITVPLLLIRKGGGSKQKNLYMGLVFMFAAALLSFITSVIQKFVADYEASIFLFVGMMGLSTMLIAGIKKIHKIKSASSHKLNSVGLHKLGFISGFVTMPSLFFLVKSYEGSFIIAYTINSFYILIPIILSIIIYKEHVNLQKWLAIGLSLIAIILFQI